MWLVYFGTASRLGGGTAVAYQGAGLFLTMVSSVSEAADRGNQTLGILMRILRTGGIFAKPRSQWLKVSVTSATKISKVYCKILNSSCKRQSLMASTWHLLQKNRETFALLPFLL